MSEDAELYIKINQNAGYRVTDDEFRYVVVWNLREPKKKLPYIGVFMVQVQDRELLDA